jgi:ArsR family transcriptional regulator
MRIKDAPPTALEASARLLKALSDPVRMRLVSLLAGQEVCVCHLHEALNLPQPTVSRHLAYLRKAGLVVGRKEGLWVHYRLSEATSELHRVILQAVAPALADIETMRADRERLSRLSCC